MSLSSVAVYVHIPFCPSKCGYCDFNSYAMSGDIMERTTLAIIKEIGSSPWEGIPATTIFFGGGTPTFLPEDQLLSILEAVLKIHPPIEGAEITSEANPGTVDMAKFSGMKQTGFNRVSLGAQSFFEDDLVRLGRIHQSHHIERAISAARDASFENLNIDLMFALPGQTLKAWETNLNRALSLGTDHLSLYGLTLEPNTPFYKQHLRGHLTQPDEEDQVDMYNLAVEMTAAAGLAQYEISNFAKPGCECQHNLCYWRNESYAGYGPGAVGFMPSTEGARRYTNLKHPERYCQAAESGAKFWFEEELITPESARLERLMLGLRLNEGLSLHGIAIDPSSIDDLLARGWVVKGDDRLKLTPAGRHFCSEVTALLI